MTFRPLDPDELPFVLDSWSLSWRTSEWSGTTPNHLQPMVTRELVGGLIARGAHIEVAAIGERIAGYVCYEHKGSDSVVHWVYVKDPYRRAGLGKALVQFATREATGVFYTHRTRYSKYIMPAVARFAPEIARRKDL